MRLLYTILLCVILSAANQNKIPTRKIIDVHFHARKFSDFANPPPPNPITGKIPAAVWEYPNVRRKEPHGENQNRAAQLYGDALVRRLAFHDWIPATNILERVFGRRAVALLSRSLSPFNVSLNTRVAVSRITLA